MTPKVESESCCVRDEDDEETYSERGHLESTAKVLPQPVRACPNREALRHFLGATWKWDRTIQSGKKKWGWT